MFPFYTSRLTKAFYGNAMMFLILENYISSALKRLFGFPWQLVLQFPALQYFHVPHFSQLYSPS